MQSMIQFVTVLVVVTHGVPLSSVDDTPKPLQNAEYNNPNDMIIPPRARGVAVIPDDYYRWPNGTVPYEMTSTILPQHQTFIVEQMRYIESVTRVNGVDCVLFRRKLVTDRYFVTVQNATGCSATLGYNNGYNGNRNLNLLHGQSFTCMIAGIIQHELLHILGFDHEQTRPDRDQYVTIQWSNIVQSSQFNFEKHNYTDVDTFQTPYDYESIMHYGGYSFAINSSVPTIIPLQNATAGIGQRDGMSPIDILEVRKYYGCLPSSTTTTAMPSNSSASSINPSDTSVASGSSSISSSSRRNAPQATASVCQTLTLRHSLPFVFAALFLNYFF